MNKQEKLLNFHMWIQLIAMLVGFVLLVVAIVSTVLATVFYVFADSPTLFWQVAIVCYVGSGIMLLTVIGNMFLLEYRLKRMQ